MVQYWSLNCSIKELIYGSVPDSSVCRLGCLCPVSYTHLDVYKRQGQTLVQVTSWYDNENSYTSQMVRTIKYFEKFVA